MQGGEPEHRGDLDDLVGQDAAADRLTVKVMEEVRSGDAHPGTLHVLDRLVE
jgi:hypothetical protein